MPLGQQKYADKQDQMGALLKHTAEANMTPTATEDSAVESTIHYTIPLVTEGP